MLPMAKSPKKCLKTAYRAKRIAFEQRQFGKTDVRRHQYRFGQQLRAAYRRLVPQIGRLRRTALSKRRGRLKRLPDSYADSKTGSIGLSWVGDKGFLGVAYSDRRDRYGLPAHSHLYDDCHADIIWQKSLINKRYLQLYPHF